MKKIVLLFAIIVTQLSTFAQVVTISQPTPGCCWYSGVDDLGGQSFTITQAGVITEIRFNTQGVEGSTTVELREGQNVSGPLLYSTVVNIAGPGMVIVPIPNIPVCEGVYCYTQSGWQWGDQNLTNPYPDGMAYYSGSWVGSIDQVFEVVQIINNEPTSPTVFTNYTVCSGTAVPLTNYTITDESPATVTASATSSNTSVIPNANIVLGGGGAARTISFSSPPTTPGTTTITLTLDDGNCNNTYTFNVTVDPTPTMTSTNSQTICSGTSANIPLTATVASTFTWVAAPNPNVTGESILAQTTSVINDNLINTTTTPQTVTYTVTPTSTTGICLGIPQVVSIIVNPIPNVTGPSSVLFCANSIYPGNTFTGTVAGTTYSWTNSDPSIGLSAGGVGNIPSFTGLNSGGSTVSATIIVTPTANGCVGPPQTFTIAVAPLPVATFSLIPDICENGGLYTLTEGSPAGGVYSGPTIIGDVFDPAAALAGTYTLTYIYTDGSLCNDTVVQTITVLPMPAVTASNDVTICEGTNTTITASGTATSFNWDNGLGAGSSHTVSPINTTTYNVTGTGANGCSATDNVVVNVNNLPVVSLVPLGDICVNATAFALSGGAPAGGIYSGTGVSGGSFDPMVAGLGTHAITYTYTDGGTTCSNFDVENILVYSAPAVSANATSTSICDGESVTLTGTGANTYAWDNGVSDGVAFAPAVGTITYTLIGTDLNGCQNTDMIDVTVNPLPTVNAGADQTICENDLVTLNGVGAATYIWNNGVVNNVAFAPPLGSTTYTLVGTDLIGCENTDDVILTVNPLPVLSLSPDQIFCLGNSLTLSAGGAVTFDWNSGAGSGNTFLITPTITTSVQVAGTSNGCTTINNIILTLDDPSLVDAGNDVIICAGFTTYLVASGGVSYSWNGPGVVNETAASYGFQVDTSAYYYLTAITSNGCSYTDSVFVTASIDPSCTILPLTSFSPNGDAVNESWLIQGINAFPNNHVTILNRWGDIVFEEDNYDNETVMWAGTQPNGTDAPEGTYFFIIEITDGPSSTGWIQLLK